MMKRTMWTGTKTRNIDDRTRQTAFWVGLVGFVQSTLLISIYAIDHTLTTDQIHRYLFYALVFSLIAWTGRTNWRVDLILSLGVAAIYFHMWWAGFHDARNLDVDASVFWFPALLFAPLFLVLITGYRSLIGYALTQGIFVYVYSRFFLADVYGLDPERLSISTFAIILGLMSGQSLLLLAILAFTRKRMDRRLFGLINETERLAAEDPLTGLKNRRAFLNQVNALWETKTAFSIVFIDLDRFKPLNDEYGHAVGDRVLQKVARRLQALPGSLCAARFGGDEFAIAIAEQAEPSALMKKIAELHQALIAPIDVGAMTITVGASLGVASTRSDGSSVSELLHAADTAMMRCKGQGGGVAKFDPVLDDIGLSASALSEAFRKALDAGKIRPALQPIVDAETRLILGYEMLARWPDSGLSRDPTPADFIPIAEKLGLLNQLLWSTLNDALPHVVNEDVFLSVNVAPSQLSSSCFLDELVMIADRHGMALDRIELEITEHAAHRNLEQNVRTLEAARRLGCRIALDDFGAGYSSLSMLEDLPLDKVKLDRGFQRKPRKRGVLEATIRLTNELGFACCVEGIECDATARLAQQLGCHQLQGYWFGAPRIIAQSRQGLKAVS